MIFSKGKGRKQLSFRLWRPAVAALLVLCCLSGQAGAQAQLQIGKSGLKGNPGTAIFGQVVEMHYYVVNVGDEAYVGDLRSHIRMKGMGNKVTSTYTFAASAPFNPGDSVEMDANTELSKQFFKKGENIIVIWPTGTSIKTLDTIETRLDVLEEGETGLSIQDTPLGGVSVYPNPSAGRIFLDFGAGSPSPVALEVYDLAGQRQTVFGRNELEAAAASGLNIEALPAGLYVCGITFRDGTRSWVRVEKL